MSGLPAGVPVGRIVPLEGRGEIFFRHHVHPTGPTLLLLHGWTASADLQWWPVYERLGRTHTIVAPDHRGHGRGLRAPFSLEAVADDCAALVVALGAGPVIAVGYSMGGPLALLLAQRHPHLVSGLVLEATALEFPSRARFVVRPLLQPTLRSRFGAFIARRGLRTAGAQAPSTRERAEWLAGELRRADPVALAEAADALYRFDANPWAGSLGVPAVVVLTTRDRLVPPTRQRALAQALRAEVVELHGDHLVNWYQPEAFAAANECAVAAVAARARV